MHNEIGWPDCQMAMPLGMFARWQIIRCSCMYMRTSNLDMVLFTIVNRRLGNPGLLPLIFQVPNLQFQCPHRGFQQLRLLLVRVRVLHSGQQQDHLAHGR